MSFSDLLLLYVPGVLMALANVPVVPAVVGLILGLIFEEQTLPGVLLAGGSIAGLFAPPARRRAPGGGCGRVGRATGPGLAPSSG